MNKFNQNNNMQFESSAQFDQKYQHQKPGEDTNQYIKKNLNSEEIAKIFKWPDFHEHNKITELNFLGKKVIDEKQPLNYQYFLKHEFSKVFSVVALSNQLLIIAREGDIERWDLKTNACTLLIRGAHKKNIKALTALYESEQVKYLISGDAEGEIKIWNLEKLKCIGNLKNEDELNILTTFSSKFIFNSGSGTHFLLTANRSTFTIKIWFLNLLDFNASKCLLTLNNERYITSLIVADEGEKLITGSNDGKIRFWDLKNRSANYKQILECHEGAIKDLIFLKDERLISASEDKTIKLWKWQKGKIIFIKSLGLHDESINALALLPDNRLISASKDRIKLWDLKTDQCVNMLNQSNLPIHSFTVLSHCLIARSNNSIIGLLNYPLRDLEFKDIKDNLKKVSLVSYKSLNAVILRNLKISNDEDDVAILRTLITNNELTYLDIQDNGINEEVFNNLSEFVESVKKKVELYHDKFNTKNHLKI